MVISHLVGYFSCHARQTHSLLCWIDFNRLKQQWERFRSALKWCDGYECVLEVIGCSLHLHNAGKAGSCVSVVCSYSLHTRLLNEWCFLFVRWLLMMFIFFVSFFPHPDLLLLLLLLDLMILNEWEWTNKFNFNFLLLLSGRERNAVFSSFTSISAFFEWHFQEQKHLKRKNEMKWKSTCCLQIGSVVKRIFFVMNIVFSEIWNV